MKYIRTKDRIYEWTGGWAYPDETVEDILNSVKALEVVQLPHLIKETEIIKQADTIEELCDEFIGVDKTKEHDKLSPLSLKSYCNYVAIYGAIWTEWGLKYVAKMNNEGELELI